MRILLFIGGWGFSLATITMLCVIAKWRGRRRVRIETVKLRLLQGGRISIPAVRCKDCGWINLRLPPPLRCSACGRRLDKGFWDWDRPCP
jgi:hypothetical protein